MGRPSRQCPSERFALPIPPDKSLNCDALDIVRILGRIEIIIDQKTKSDSRMHGANNGDSSLSSKQTQPAVDNEKITSMRIYDGFINDKRCFLKEFLPVGQSFGKNELSVYRRMSGKWNRIQGDLNNANVRRPSSLYNDPIPPFPVLIGHFLSDDFMETLDFRQRWRRRFPGVRPPDRNNLWLAFEWDNSTFRTLRSFPPLPQVVEGLDYFRKDQRTEKRWRFIRKVLRKTLETLDFFHNCGYSHNALSIQSLWMSTTMQQKISNLTVQITDVGASSRLPDDPSMAQREIIEDYYQLAFIFLEFVVSSFNDDNIGARQIRELLGQRKQDVNIFTRYEDIDQSQLTQREFQQVFERLCESDIMKLRMLVRSMSRWREVSEILERDAGAAWKLLFKMLARGTLYEEDRVTPMRVSGRRLIRSSITLFADTF